MVSPLQAESPPRLQILVVDDEPVNLQIMYASLGNDYELFMATSGTEALELCRKQRPDLMLLDIMMPDLDGLSVCRQLKQDDDLKDIPVIFVTAKNTPDEESEAFDAGAADFVSKPINPTVVRARVRTHLTLKIQTDKLKQQAYIDGLTGVANRRCFERALDRQWRSCMRIGCRVTLYMIDVDFFKGFNDRYGHPAGDDCLIKVAAALEAVMQRSNDMVARYGGEEFFCMSVGLDDAMALKTAEMLRDRVLKLAIPHEGSEVADVVSVSIGLASEQPSDMDGMKKLLALADQRLYQAKRGGRNRVVASD